MSILLTTKEDFIRNKKEILKRIGAIHGTLRGMLEMDNKPPSFEYSENASESTKAILEKQKLKWKDISGKAFNEIKNSVSHDVWTDLKSHKRFKSAETNYDFITLWKILVKEMKMTEKEQALARGEFLRNLENFKQSKETGIIDFLSKFGEKLDETRDVIEDCWRIGEIFLNCLHPRYSKVKEKVHSKSFRNFNDIKKLIQKYRYDFTQKDEDYASPAPPAPLFVTQMEDEEEKTPMYPVHSQHHQEYRNLKRNFKNGFGKPPDKKSRSMSCKYCIKNFPQKPSRHSSHDSKDCFWKNKNGNNISEPFQGQVGKAFPSLMKGLLGAIVFTNLENGEIILDTGASFHVLNENSPHHSVRPMEKKVTLNTMMGDTDATHLCVSTEWGECLFVPNSPVSALSFSQLLKFCDIEMVEIDNQKQFYVLNKTTGNAFYTKTHQSVYFIQPMEENILKKIQWQFEKKLGLSVVRFPEREDQNHWTTETVEDSEEEESIELRSPDFDREVERASALHKVLAHPYSKYFVRALKHGSFKSLNISTAAAREACRRCNACVEGKMDSRNELKILRPHYGVGELIHIDLVYIQNLNTCLFIGVDHKTGFTYATTIKSKSHEQILPACDAVAGYLKAPIVTFAADRESSISKSKIFLHARRFDLRQTSPYVHEKFAERKVRTIRNGMRTILADLPYALPLMLYVHLFSWVAFMQNILPNSKTGNQSPWEIVHGRQFHHEHLQFKFGEVGFFHNLHLKNKSSPRSELGIFVGFEYQSRTLHAFIFSKRLVLQRDKFKPLSFLSEEIKNKLAKFVLMNTPSVEVKIFRETDVSGNPEEPQPSEQQIAEGILESISGNDHNDGDGHNNFYDPTAPVSGSVK